MSVGREIEITVFATGASSDAGQADVLWRRGGVSMCAGHGNGRLYLHAWDAAEARALAAALIAAADAVDLAARQPAKVCKLTTVCEVKP